MNNDKQTEYLRYEARAKFLLAAGTSAAKSALVLGSLTVPAGYRVPYIYYEQCQRRYISQCHDVLELGSGTGLHTYALTQTGARVVASDISSHALQVLSQRIGLGVKTRLADMENLPFETDSFDVVASAGSLSYGDPCPGGSLLCVDSLNHNPIYQFNRWFHYMRGLRTKSTLLRIPTIDRIQSISKRFKSTEVRFFGAVSYLMPLLACIIGQNHAAKVSDAVDRIVHVRRSAFKFVLAAIGRL